MDEGEGSLDLFAEPEGYYKPDAKPTQVQHRTLKGDTLHLHLVGQNPLWGHLLWQGGRTVADYLESNRDRYVQDRTVLELGAGAGLPSLVCAINGAKYVLVTDYPDADLIENLSKNIQDCAWVPNPPNIEAEGYLWGADVSNLNRRASASGADAGFDLLILADLLFNHSEHERLLATVQRTLKRVSEAQALVFFTPYRPWLFEKDLAFFEIAKSGGFVVEKVLEKVMDKVMFDEDRGDELLRRTVFGYRMCWSAESLGKGA